MTAQQLKNSILQLAVQGKLVPQDPNDEPASVLLERIRAEKEQLIKAGRIRREKNPSVIFRGADNIPYEKIGDEVIPLDVPFDIPDTWEWVRVKNFCLDIFNGKSPRYVKTPTEYRIVGQAANQQNGLDFSQLKFTDGAFWNEMDEKYFLRHYDVLLNTLGNGTLGRSGIVTDLPFPLLTDGHLFVFRTPNEITGWYIYCYLQHRKIEIEKSANGSTNQTFLNLKQTMEWLIPVPPLAEQKRIIEKIKEVLPHLDIYAEAYERTVILDAKFSTDLKKSILQWAVQGKLVPQDENDEPAEVLLARIRAEKEALIKAGRIKRDKHESVIFRRDNSHYEKLDDFERRIDDELPFEIPTTWVWTRLKNIACLFSGNQYPETENGVLYIKVADMNLPANQVEITTSTRCAICDASQVISPYSIIFPKRGGAIATNKKRIVKSTPVCVDSNTMAMSVVDEGIFDYIKLWFDGIDLGLLSTGTSVPQINNKDIEPLLVPLPPYNEQKRIVAALEKIIPLCEAI